MVSPHAQEVEFALILSRMINTVKEDPAQLRLSIYEFARARLKLDTSWAEEAERERFSAALETAIQGLNVSARRDEKERLQPPTPANCAWRLCGRTAGYVDGDDPSGKLRAKKRCFERSLFVA